MPVKFVSEMFGRPADEVTLFVSILIAFVLSFPQSFIRNVTLRKLYSTGIGLSLTFFTYGIYTLLLIPYNMTAYFAMLLLPRKYAVYLIILITGGLLTANNYYEMITEDVSFNVSVLMLITFCK